MTAFEPRRCLLRVGSGRLRPTALAQHPRYSKPACAAGRRQFGAALVSLERASRIAGAAVGFLGSRERAYRFKSSLSYFDAAWE